VGAGGAVWLVPQCFDHVNGPGTYRMPTVAEQRCMCYLGLIHGARGLLWFTYSGYCEQDVDKSKAQGTIVWKVRGSIPKHFPAEYEGIERLAAEATELAPVWFAPPIAQARQVTAGGEAVHTYLAEHNGRRYLFAVNAGDAAVDFACTLRGGKDAAEVLWENRRVDLAGGKLADSFEPYEVHVYRWPHDR
jgi:hypothetical protein